MKYLFIPCLFLISFFLLVCSTNVVAQNESNLPTPEFEMQPYWYDETAKSLRSFEKVPFQSQTRAKGLYGAEGLAFIEGRESPLQFKDFGKLTILIKMEKGKDPSDVLQLCEFTTSKKRELVTSSRSGWDGGVTQRSAGINILEFKKVREGVYQIILIKKLQQGEYAFENGF